jgi:hypothetical protein
MTAFAGRIAVVDTPFVGENDFYLECMALGEPSVPADSELDQPILFYIGLVDKSIPIATLLNSTNTVGSYLLLTIANRSPSVFDITMKNFQDNVITTSTNSISAFDTIPSFKIRFNNHSGQLRVWVSHSGTYTLIFDQVIEFIDTFDPSLALGFNAANDTSMELDVDFDSFNKPTNTVGLTKTISIPVPLTIPENAAGKLFLVEGENTINGVDVKDGSVISFDQDGKVIEINLASSQHGGLAGAVTSVPFSNTVPSFLGIFGITALGSGNFNDTGSVYNITGNGAAFFDELAAGNFYIEFSNFTFGGGGNLTVICANRNPSAPPFGADVLIEHIISPTSWMALAAVGGSGGSSGSITMNSDTIYGLQYNINAETISIYKKETADSAGVLLNTMSIDVHPSAALNIGIVATAANFTVNIGKIPFVAEPSLTGFVGEGPTTPFTGPATFRGTFDPANGFPDTTNMVPGSLYYTSVAGYLASTGYYYNDKVGFWFDGKKWNSYGGSVGGVDHGSYIPTAEIIDSVHTGRLLLPDISTYNDKDFVHLQNPNNNNDVGFVGNDGNQYLYNQVIARKSNKWEIIVTVPDSTRAGFNFNSPFKLTDSNSGGSFTEDNSVFFTPKLIDVNPGYNTYFYNSGITGFAQKSDCGSRLGNCINAQQIGEYFYHTPAGTSINFNLNDNGPDSGHAEDQFYVHLDQYGNIYVKSYVNRGMEPFLESTLAGTLGGLVSTDVVSVFSVRSKSTIQYPTSGHYNGYWHLIFAKNGVIVADIDIATPFDKSAGLDFNDFLTVTINHTNSNELYVNFGQQPYLYPMLKIQGITSPDLIANYLKTTNSCLSTSITNGYYSFNPFWDTDPEFNSSEILFIYPYYDSEFTIDLDTYDLANIKHVIVLPADGGGSKYALGIVNILYSGTSPKVFTYTSSFKTVINPRGIIIPPTDSVSLEFIGNGDLYFKNVETTYTNVNHDLITNKRLVIDITGGSFNDTGGSGNAIIDPAYNNPSITEGCFLDLSNSGTSVQTVLLPLKWPGRSFVTRVNSGTLIFSNGGPYAPGTVLACHTNYNESGVGTDIVVDGVIADPSIYNLHAFTNGTSPLTFADEHCSGKIISFNPSIPFVTLPDPATIQFFVSNSESRLTIRGPVQFSILDTHASYSIGNTTNSSTGSTNISFTIGRGEVTLIVDGAGKWAIESPIVPNDTVLEFTTSFTVGHLPSSGVDYFNVNGIEYRVNSASDITVTLDSSAVDNGINAESVFYITRWGTGDVILTGNGGSVINSPSGYLKIANQYDTVRVRVVNNTLYHVSGPLKA